MNKSKNNKKTTTARTLNSVQNSLNKSKNDTSRKENPYLRCVFDPFSSRGKGMMRPDSGSNKVIMRDILQAFDITCDKPIGLKLSPMYPYILSTWANSTTALVVNGLTVPTTFEALGVGYTPTAGKSDSDYGGGTQVAMVDYDRARISTVGWRLMYTGKALDAIGYILVDTTPFSIEVTDRQVPNTCTYATFAGANIAYPLNTQIGYASIETATFSSGGTTFFPITPTQTSELFRPEVGAHGILRRSAYSPNHTFKPVHNPGIAPIEFRGDPNASRSFISAPRVNTVAGVTIIDDDWDSTMIYISGAGSYRLELVVCLEAIVTQQSPLEPLAKASPALNQAVLEREAAAMSDMPVAVSVNSKLVNPSMLSTPESEAARVARIAQNAVSDLLTKKAPPLPPRQLTKPKNMISVRSAGRK